MSRSDTSGSLSPLPSLVQLDVETNDTRVMQQIRKVISPSLRSLRFVVDIRPTYISIQYSNFTEAIIQFLHVTTGRASKLTNLAVEVHGIRPEPLNGYLPSLVEGLPLLSEFSWQIPMTLENLNVMQAWTHLRTLHVNLELAGPNAYMPETIALPNLHSLSISGWPRTLVSVFGKLHMPVLRKINFPAVRPGERIETY
ncbi:hypothetical protein DACRYDRAFT_24923, partial [Dacryopinax primogenitus]